MASGSDVKVVVSAIAGNIFITIIKFIAWFFTRSPSILAEAVHSLADSLNQILLFVGLKHSEKESNKLHPTGHGRARYLWNLVSAVGIFFLGFGVTAYHGLHSLISGGSHSTEISWIAVGVLIVSFLIEGYVLIGAYKIVVEQKGKRSFLEYFKESDDPTTVAVLLEDGVAVLGVLLALGGIVLGHIFGSPMFDIVASLFIAALLGFMAIALGIINGKLLLGRTAAVYKHEEIEKFIEGLPEVLSIDNIHTSVMGAGQIRLSMEVELNGDRLIDSKALRSDAEKLESGEDKIKVLHHTSERMVRIVGKTINDLELQIQNRFPEIKIIDFEVS